MPTPGPIIILSTQWYKRFYNIKNFILREQSCDNRLTQVDHYLWGNKQRSPGSASCKDHSPSPAPNRTAENWYEATKWAALWQNKQNDICAQRRLRSAWVYYQRLRCPYEEALGHQLPIERTAKTLIRLGGFPGWSESSLGALSFCWFCNEAALISKRSNCYQTIKYKKRICDISPQNHTRTEQHQNHHIRTVIKNKTLSGFKLLF